MFSDFEVECAGAVMLTGFHASSSCSSAGRFLALHKAFLDCFPYGPKLLVDFCICAARAPVCTANWPALCLHALARSFGKSPCLDTPDRPVRRLRHLSIPCSGGRRWASFVADICSNGIDVRHDQHVSWNACLGTLDP